MSGTVPSRQPPVKCHAALQVGIFDLAPLVSSHHSPLSLRWGPKAASHLCILKQTFKKFIFTLLLVHGTERDFSKTGLVPLRSLDVELKFS